MEYGKDKGMLNNIKVKHKGTTWTTNAQPNMCSYMFMMIIIFIMSSAQEQSKHIFGFTFNEWAVMWAHGRNKETVYRFLYRYLWWEMDRHITI